jgi:hypothetical protein
MKKTVQKDQLVKGSCSERSAPIERTVLTVLSFI